MTITFSSNSPASFDISDFWLAVIIQLIIRHLASTFYMYKVSLHIFLNFTYLLPSSPLSFDNMF